MRAKKTIFVRASAWLMIVFLAVPPGSTAQQSGKAAFNPGQLDQILAPIALYPDPLISQILIASTYPLEIVQAARFAEQNKNLKGDALTKALEAQSWDPSVKSLVNFPEVLTMMNKKLDWTQKLGDAFLEQQEQVMNTIQSLRAKAEAAGNLKSTPEQKVIVEQKIIKIEPASPQVIYVPTYNPTIVYGTWPYPAYPPYYYYPPGYVAARSAFWFASGVALGAAWGYAWGSPSWRGGTVKYNYNQNININRNINRNKYATTLPARGQGNWQHNPAHRKGVSYRDQATAQRYNRASTNDAIRSREAYRGRTGQGAQQRPAGGSQALGGRQGQKQPGARPSQGPVASNRGSLSGGAGSRASPGQLGSAGQANRGGAGARGGAFQGIDRGGSAARSASQRGSTSRRSFGGGGAARTGRGGARGGGRRR